MNTRIQTPTNNLQQSLDFYSKLEFRIIAENSSTFISDGKVLIEINPDRYARAGIKLVQSSWKKEVKELEKLTAVIKTKNGFLLADYSGTWIYLDENSEEINYEISEIPAPVIGNYMGVSLEVIDLKKSMELWNMLGFSNTSGSPDQGWVGLTNENNFTINLMKPMSCPHLFFNPSLTFFNSGKNMEVIEKVRKLNISITEEITHFNKQGLVDNIIIRDPGGLGFFIFND